MKIKSRPRLVLCDGGAEDAVMTVSLATFEEETVGGGGGGGGGGGDGGDDGSRKVCASCSQKTSVIASAKEANRGDHVDNVSDEREVRKGIDKSGHHTHTHTHTHTPQAQTYDSRIYISYRGKELEPGRRVVPADRVSLGRWRQGCVICSLSR